MTGMWLRKVGQWLRRVPFTAGFLVVFWLVGLLTGTVVSGPRGELLGVVGFGARPLAQGHWWSLGSSLLWAGGWPQYVLVSVSVALLGGLAERRIGTFRTVVAFVATYVVGEMLSLAAVGVGAAIGDSWSQGLLGSVVVTPSAAAFGASLAASSALPAVWRRRLWLTLILTMAMLTLYVGFLQDLVRLCAGLCGLALSPLVVRQRERPARAAPSRVEARLLIAMLVAASAIGPLVATASGTGPGPPLSILQYLVSSPHPTAVEVGSACADPTTMLDCLQVRAALRLSGLGPAFLSIIPVLLLLVMAEGLRRGRRFAWWGALGVNVALTVLGVFLLPSYLSSSESVLWSSQGWADVLVPLLQPVLIIGLLLVHRRKFDVAAPRGAYRRLTVVTGSTLLVCAVVYVAGSYLVRDQLDPKPTGYQILLDLPLRFAPPGYLGELPITFLPTGTLAGLLYNWTGVVFWLVAFTGCVITFILARVEGHDRDRDRARALLHRHGGTSMSYMIIWPGNSYWFSPDGQAVVAYRVFWSVALTTGEPVGAPQARRLAAEHFARFCASKGWTPCFYGITQELSAGLPAGWNTVQIAEEALLPLPDLQFRGKKFQNVRTALNKAKTLGITAARISYQDAPPQIADQIRSLSHDWLEHKRMPEMGFTLGTIDELDSEDVRCLVAVDSTDKLHGVTSWLPIRREGEIIGWTLDVMRRASDGFPGVMEFLIASMALQCQEEGTEFLSLSGTPLARLDRGERPVAVERILDFVGRKLEPVYGFRSLMAFKAKFQPQYRPLFMTYPDAAALPSIGNAVMLAYLPKLTFEQCLRLLRTLLVHVWPAFLRTATNTTLTL